METFGSLAKTWQAAKDEIKVVLIDCARRQETIAYSELVQKITALDLQAHDPRLDKLLGQYRPKRSDADRECPRCWWCIRQARDFTKFSKLSVPKSCAFKSATNPFSLGHVMVGHP